MSFWHPVNEVKEYRNQYCHIYVNEEKKGDLKTLLDPNIRDIFSSYVHKLIISGLPTWLLAALLAGYSSTTCWKPFLAPSNSFILKSASPLRNRAFSLDSSNSRAWKHKQSIQILMITKEKKDIGSIYPGPHSHLMLPMSFIKAIPCHSFPEPCWARSSWGSTWPGWDVQPVAVLWLSSHPLPTTQIHVPAMKQSFCTATPPACIYLPEINTRKVWKINSFIHKIDRKCINTNLKVLCSFLLDNAALFQFLFRVHLPWFFGLIKKQIYKRRNTFWHHQLLKKWTNLFVLISLPFQRHLV